MKVVGVLIEAFSLQSMDTMKTCFIWLLRAGWAAGTLPFLIASLPCSRLGSFHTLVLGYVKRGKIMPSSSSHKLTVPQSFYLHFYLLAVVWTTVLLMGTWWFADKVAPLSHLTGGGSHVFSLHKSGFTSADDRLTVCKSVFLLLLMEIHVLRRLYETLFVFNYSSSARMHVVGYFTGICYYIAAPLSLSTFCAADQVAEFNVEGQEMVSITGFDLRGYVKPITSLGWCQWAGAAIFAWGWLHQCSCHAILGSLRTHRSDQTVEYVIPRGDWFNIVSSPHYLAEMVIYVGLLVASGGTDLTIWLLLGFVVANLAFAAADTHRWYLHKFEDYPPDRWAILPFVY
ncbi:hypothetical protein QUC31_006642 [Theobroma cacao]